MYALLTAIALGTSGCERDLPLTTAPQAVQQAQRGSVSADTTRPPVPEQLNPPDDSSFTVVAPGDTLPIYYRNIVMIVFDDTTRGVTIRGLLRKYQGTIIGGAPAVGRMGAYLIQVPDPGADFAALDSLLQRIEGEPGVSHTIPVTFRDLWDPKVRATRPRLAVRVPLSPADTGRPELPSGPLSLPDDSSTTVRRPGGDTANVYYRNVLQLTFDDSTSGPTVRDVLARYHAEIIGGGSYPGIRGGAYVIRVPDPGASFAAVQDLLSRLRAEPGVHHVRAMMFGARFEAR